MLEPEDCVFAPFTEEEPVAMASQERDALDHIPSPVEDLCNMEVRLQGVAVREEHVLNFTPRSVTIRLLRVSASMKNALFPILRELAAQTAHQKGLKLRGRLTEDLRQMLHR